MKNTRERLLNRLSYDFLAEVAKGKIDGHSLVRMFGRNLDVDTALVDITMEDTIFTWPTSAATLEAISNNADDTSAGTGARVITVTGLDGNFDVVSEDITMNGTIVTSATTATFIRVNSVDVKEAGIYSSTSVGANAGDITVRVSSGGATLAFITSDPIGAGRSQDFKYTIPNAKTAIIIAAGLNVDATKLAKVFFFTRISADVVTVPFSSKRIGAVLSEVEGRIDVPKENLNFALPGKTDLWGAAIANAVNTEVAISMTILQIDD